MQFHQPSPQAFALNKVTGPSMSLIAGTIQANGRVGLINQNGIAFLDGALIDTNGFIASTLDMDKERFIHHGELFFESTPGKNIPVIGVFGDVTFSGAGLAGFVGPFHRNGNLVASEVHVVTADKVAVSIGQSNKVRFQVEGELKAELIDNMGSHEAISTAPGAEIKAERVYLTARTVESMVDQVIHLKGNITAKGLGIDTKGEIILDAGPNITAHISGTWQALNGNGSGGIIEVLNSAVIEDSAIFNVSGLAGGNHAAGGLFLGVGRHFDITSAARLRVNPLYAKNLIVRPGAQFKGAAYGTGDGARMLFIAENLLQIEGGSIWAPYDTGTAPFIEVSTAGVSKGLFPSSLNLKSRVLRKGESFASGIFMIDPNRLDVGPEGTTGPIENFAKISALNAALKGGAHVILAAIDAEGASPNKIVFHGDGSEPILIDGGILSLVSHKLELNGAFQFANDGILMLTPDYVPNQDGEVSAPEVRPRAFNTSVTGKASFSRKVGDDGTAILILNYAGNGTNGGQTLPQTFTVDESVTPHFQTMIYSPADIQFIRDNLGGKFTLANARTVFGGAADPFSPIARTFKGRLNGLHPVFLAPASLVDLNITKASNTVGDGIGRSGFFEKIGDGFVSNVEFLDASVVPTGQVADGGDAIEVGVVAGRIEPTQASIVPNIENVHVKWEKKIKDSGYHVIGSRGDKAGPVYVGALAGVVTGKARIEGSSVRAELAQEGGLLVEGMNAGGGGVQDGDIIIGVNHSGDYKRFVGGFAGDVAGAAVIERSFVEGITVRAMTADDAITPNLGQQQSMVGGFTSSVWDTAEISHAWAGATVNAAGIMPAPGEDAPPHAMKVGGFAGFQAATAHITNTYSWGPVLGSVRNAGNDVDMMRNIGAIQQNLAPNLPSGQGVGRILLADKNKFAQYENFVANQWHTDSDKQPPYFPPSEFGLLQFSFLAGPAQPAPQQVVEVQGAGNNPGQGGVNNEGSNTSETATATASVSPTAIDTAGKLQNRHRTVNFAYNELGGVISLAGNEEAGTEVDRGVNSGENKTAIPLGSTFRITSGLRLGDPGAADYLAPRINLRDFRRVGPARAVFREIAAPSPIDEPTPALWFKDAPAAAAEYEPLAPASNDGTIEPAAFDLTDRRFGDFSEPVVLAGGPDVLAAGPLGREEASPELAIPDTSTQGDKARELEDA